MERWKWIRRHRGRYMVSTRGRIKSFVRGERVLKPGTARKYLKVTLCDRDGNKRDFLVHRLVAEAFVPNPDNLPEVNHKDLNKTNNRKRNLEWCTPKGNTDHAKKNKAYRSGEECHLSTMTKRKVRKIRRLAGRVPQSTLARRFHTTQGNISQIVNFRTWVF